MPPIRYLLDENIPHAVRDQLLRREPAIQILAVGDEMAPDLGTPDPLILVWMEQHEMALISRNRRSMPLHLREHLAGGRHVPGIFMLRRKCSLGQAIEDLLLIWQAGQADAFRDHITYLPL